MNENPLVSVVMTSYNRAHFICSAIDSILSQDCSFPIEIIIGDDCSTDGSRALLDGYKEKYPDVFVLNYQNENQGFGSNWAMTCKMARGKYIAFLDDDDYWCDNHRLQDMVDFFETHNKCGLVYTNYWVLNVSTGKKTISKDTYAMNEEEKLRHMLSKGFPILFSSCMVRKSVMEEYVDLDAYMKLRFEIQDFPTAVLIAPHCEFHFMEQPSVVYRSYAGSMSKPQSYEAIIRKYTQEKVMNRYLYEQIGLEYDEAEDDRYRNSILLSLACAKGDYRKAKEFAKRSGRRSLKCYSTYTWLSFQVYRLLNRIKARL